MNSIDGMLHVPPESNHVDRFYIPTGGKQKYQSDAEPVTVIDLKDTIRDKSRVIRDLEKQVETTTAGHEQLLGRLQSTDEEKNTLEWQHHSSETEVKRLSSELHICASEKSILSAELRTKDVIIADLQQELTDLSNTLLFSNTSVNGQVLTLRHELDSRDAIISKLQSQLDHKDSEIQSQRTSLSEVTMRMRDLEISTQTRSNESQVYIDNLRNDTELCRIRIAEMSDIILDKKDEINVLQASNTQWLRQYRKLKQQFQSQTKQLEYIKCFEGDPQPYGEHEQSPAVEAARLRYQEVAIATTPHQTSPLRIHSSVSNYNSIESVLK